MPSKKKQQPKKPLYAVYDASEREVICDGETFTDPDTALGEARDYAQSELEQGTKIEDLYLYIVQLVPVGRVELEVPVDVSARLDPEDKDLT